MALPVLMADLGVPPSAAQWLTTAFLLTMAVVIPVTGFLSSGLDDPVAVRRGDGAVLRRARCSPRSRPGSRCCSPRRVVQATGTAIMMPLLMTTVMTLVPPARRGAMMGNISIVISVAPAIGPDVVRA